MFIRAIKRLERSQEYSPQKFGKGPPGSWTRIPRRSWNRTIGRRMEIGCITGYIWAREQMALGVSSLTRSMYHFHEDCELYALGDESWHTVLSFFTSIGHRSTTVSFAFEPFSIRGYIAIRGWTVATLPRNLYRAVFHTGMLNIPCWPAGCDIRADKRSFVTRKIFIDFLDDGEKVK